MRELQERGTLDGWVCETMLADYVQQFRELRVDVAHGPERVHKPCMLLVVIEFGERGLLSKGRIQYEHTRERFRAYARAVRPDQDMKPYLPFYHLKSARFWTLVARKGAELPTKARDGQLRGVSARLDPELSRLLSESAVAREKLRYALIDKWFPEMRGGVGALVAQSRGRQQSDVSAP